MNRKTEFVLISLISFFLASNTLVLGRQAPQTSVLSKVGIDQQLGSQLMLDLQFLDESGEAVTLAPSLLPRRAHL